MIGKALLLIGLTIALPVLATTSWLNWQKVGEATLTWGPFTVYHSQLFTPDGRPGGPGSDRALVITYLRDVDREDLIEATRKQWQALGIMTNEAESEAWLKQLDGFWPDVHPGTQLTFSIISQQGQFWYRASAAQKGFIPIGPPQSLRFSQSFLAIWLDPHTQYPELRQQLLGGRQ
ncbi:hypothetical protein SAMN02744775_02826 [Enterobacter sp. CC120223-11]|nr:hypothetical protein SAMN02744775_02826 [Enterobacter sp. CC120223-11]